MNTSIRNIIFTSTTVLFACDSFEDQNLELELDDEDHEIDLDETVEPSPNGATELASESQAEPCSLVECDGTRIMVGILDLENYPNASCNPGEVGLSMPDGWVWDTMFETGHPLIQPPVSALPPELRKFCMFTYVAESDPHESDYEPFFALMGNWKEIAEFGPDCMGMAAAGEMNGGAVRQALRMAMLDNIHMPPVLPTCAGTSCPEVVVLDTQVGTFTNPGPYVSDHGLLVAGIITAIRGPWGREITSENAFPGTTAAGESSGLDWTTGGNAGSMATLALALFKSTWGFRAGILGGSKEAPARSTVNISLGYLRELSPGYPETPPGKALHAALQYASCSGQLLAVAAGNNTDERCPQNQTGPLAPGIFETEEAPTDEQCATLEFALPLEYTSVYPRVPVDPHTYNPLVWAVGGVDGQDLRLANTREGGQPRLVAYASNSVGVDHLFDPARAAMTGTSAAAAAVTGVASSLWGLAPELSGADLMRIIYESGYSIGEFSNFQLGVAPQPIHRLAYCPALAAVCQDKDPSTCPTPNCSARRPEQHGYLEDYANAVDFAISNGTTYEVKGILEPSAPVCENHDLSQLLLENPEDPPCPHCNITKGTPSVVNMDIVPQYKGLIDKASITITRSDNSIAQVDFDGNTVNQLNDPTVGTVIATINEPNVAKATLHLTINYPAATVKLDSGFAVYQPTGGN